MKERHGHLVAAIGTVAALFVLLLPAGVARTIPFNLLAGACLIVMLVAIRRHRPDGRRAWTLVLAGNALLVTGDLAFALLELVGEVGAVSLADPIYLAGYPVMAAGFLLALRSRAGRQFRAALVDAAVFGLTGGVLIWATILAPQRVLPGSGLDRVVLFSYPFADLIVMALVLRLALDGGWRLASQVYAMAALLLLLGGDLAYSASSPLGEYELGSFFDTAWLLSYVAWAAAMAHPSMCSVTSSMVDRSRTLVRSHVAILVLAAVTVSAISTLRTTPPLERGAMLVITTAVITLVAWRAWAVSAALRAVADEETARARQTEQRLAALVERAPDLIVVVADDGRISYASPAIERILGWTADEARALPPMALLHPDERAYVTSEDAWRQARSNRVGPVQPVESRWRHKSGQWRSMEVIATDLTDDPAVCGLVLNGRDVTERLALEHELTRQAFHDALTGLPNRALFTNRVEHALQHRNTSTDPRRVAVLFCDLDDFKSINDAFGHGAGDQLLQEVGARLAAVTRPGDTVARLGGDEFAVLVEGVSDDAAVDRIAAKVLEALEGEHQLAGATVRVTGSVGAAAALPGEAPAETLLRDADAAMYAAKRQGKNTWAWYDIGMHEAIAARLQLEQELRVALAEGQLEVHYQPLVELATSAITGAEALVRWRHPSRGLVPPIDFIPIAEETGLVVPLGWWVLEQACEFAASMRHEIEGFTISVNLSALQLAESDLAVRVGDALASSGLAPHALTMEITETLVASDAPEVMGRLEALKALGVRIAIDDFGTGYSSLSYLQRLPVDILKIDKSFVDGVAGGEGNLVPVILDAARTLGLTTVAEGIEQLVQAEELTRLGCDRAQGYYFARPLPPADFALHCRVPACTE